MLRWIDLYIKNYMIPFKTTIDSHLIFMHSSIKTITVNIPTILNYSLPNKSRLKTLNKEQFSR